MHRGMIVGVPPKVSEPCYQSNPAFNPLHSFPQQWRHSVLTAQYGLTVQTWQPLTKSESSRHERILNGYPGMVIIVWCSVLSQMRSHAGGVREDTGGRGGYGRCLTTPGGRWAGCLSSHAWETWPQTAFKPHRDTWRSGKGFLRGLSSPFV